MSHSRQRSMIALLMGAVLVLSLGAAYLLSAARGTQQAVELERVSVEPFELPLPSRWERQPALEHQLELQGVRVYQDPARRSRQLLVAPVSSPGPSSVVEVLEFFQALLLTRREQETFEVYSQRVDLGPRDHGAEQIGMSEPAGPGVVHLHLIATLGAGAEEFVLLYMWDVEEGSAERIAQRLRWNRELFYEIQAGAEVEAGD